jgi:hypothetical protein
LLPLDKHLPLFVAVVGRIFMVGLAYVGACVVPAVTRPIPRAPWRHCG